MEHHFLHVINVAITYRLSLFVFWLRYVGWRIQSIIKKLFQNTRILQGHYILCEWFLKTILKVCRGKLSILFLTSNGLFLGRHQLLRKYIHICPYVKLFRIRMPCASRPVMTPFASAKLKIFIIMLSLYTAS